MGTTFQIWRVTLFLVKTPGKRKAWRHTYYVLASDEGAAKALGAARHGRLDGDTIERVAKVTAEPWGLTASGGFHQDDPVEADPSTLPSAESVAAAAEILRRADAAEEAVFQAARAATTPKLAAAWMDDDDDV